MYIHVEIHVCFCQMMSQQAIYYAIMAATVFETWKKVFHNILFSPSVKLN